MTQDICVLCSLTCTWTPGLLSLTRRASHSWTIHISFLVLLQCVVCTQHSSLTFVTANCGNGKQTNNYANSSKFYCLIVSKSILIEAPTLGVSCPGPVSLDYVMEVDSLRFHQEILQSQTGCPIKTSRALSPESLGTIGTANCNDVCTDLGSGSAWWWVDG